MTEKKQRANPNYEASAVNLTNPPILELGLNRLHFLREALDNVLTDIEKSIPPELKVKRTQVESDIETQMALLKVAIDKEGSYQNTERGLYALKQRRVSVTYEPGLTRQTIGDQLADIVIEPVVNKAKLEGLVKGGLVTDNQLANCGKTSESFSYIIR